MNAELANTLPTFSYVIAHMYSLQSQNFGGSEVGDRGKKAVGSALANLHMVTSFRPLRWNSEAGDHGYLAI